jgi:hypothetical protein
MQVVAEDAAWDVALCSRDRSQRADTTGTHRELHRAEGELPGHATSLAWPPPLLPPAHLHPPQPVYCVWHGFRIQNRVPRRIHRVPPGA